MSFHINSYGSFKCLQGCRSYGNRFIYIFLSKSTIDLLAVRDLLQSGLLKHFIEHLSVYSATKNGYLFFWRWSSTDIKLAEKFRPSSCRK